MGGSRHILAKVKERLTNIGMKEINPKRLKSSLKKYHVSIGVNPDTFRIYNRNGSYHKSNFFVFVGESKDSVIITYYNPQSPFENGNIKRKDVIVKWKVKNDVYDLIIDDITETMRYKSSDTYYLHPHNHAGKIYFNGKVYDLISIKPRELPNANGPIDDGKSDPPTMIMAMAFAHTDFFAITSHNHFYRPLYDELRDMGRELNIVIVPGTEFTMPPYGYDAQDVAMLLEVLNKKLGEDINIKLPKNMFGGYSYKLVKSLIDKYGDLLKDEEIPLRIINGPHIVVLYKTPEIGEEVQKRFLDKRDVMYAPISSVGVELIPTLTKIKKRYGKDVVVIVAHPFCDLALPNVGIGNRIEIGEFNMSILRYLYNKGLIDGIAAYNPGVKEEEHPFKPALIKPKKEYPMQMRKEIKNINKKRVIWVSRFRRFIDQILIEKWGVKIEKSYEMNMALGRWMVKTFGLPLFGEADTHFYGTPDVRDMTATNLIRVVTVVKGIRKKTISGLFNAIFRCRGACNRKEERNIDYIAYVKWNPEKQGFEISDERKPTLKEKIIKSWITLKSYGLQGGISVLIPDVINRLNRNMKGKLRGLSYILRKFAKR